MPYTLRDDTDTGQALFTQGRFPDGQEPAGPSGRADGGDPAT